MMMTIVMMFAKLMETMTMIMILMHMTMMMMMWTMRRNINNHDDDDIFGKQAPPLSSCVPRRHDLWDGLDTSCAVCHKAFMIHFILFKGKSNGEFY